MQSRGFIAEVIGTQRIKSARLQIEEGAVSIIVPAELPSTNHAGQQQGIRQRRGLCLSRPQLRWYRTQAESRVSEKVQCYAQIVGVAPNAVGIKTFKSCWGNRNIKDEIQFHWKAIMAPHRIVTYLAVHELCYLKHHDHSAVFWKSVERMVPDYLECKGLLRLVGGRFDV